VAAQPSFQLFSDQLKPTSRQQQYVDAVAQLQGFVKNCQLYGREHQIVEASQAAMMAGLTSIFSLAQCLFILRLNDQMYIQDIPVDSQEGKIHGIAESLDRHQVRKVMIWRGVTPDQLMALAELLAMKPEDVINQGGFAYLLSRRRAKQVEVRTMTFSAAGEGVDGAAAGGLGRGQRHAVWQTALTKAGVGQDEFLNYLNFAPTANKLMTRELRLAVPVLTDARAVSELVLHMSQDPDHPDEIDCDHLFQVLRRIENVLLVHSAMSQDAITDLLRRATRMFSREHRLDLLQTTLEYAAYGKPLTNLEVLDVAPEEIYDVLTVVVEHRDDAPFMQYLMATPKIRESVMLQWELYLIDAGHTTEVVSTTRKTLESLLRKGDEALEAEPVTAEPAANANALGRARLANLKTDLEIGYLFALADMLTQPGTEERVADVRTRLGALIDYYFTTSDSRVLFAVLGRLATLANADHDQVVTEFWQGISSSYVQQILKLTKVRCQEDPVAAAEFLSGIERFLPEFAGNQIVQLALDDPDPQVRNTMVNVLVFSKRDLMGIIQERLTSDVPHWRMNALDMLIAYQTDHANAMMELGLQDSAQVVRLGTVRMIASTNSKSSLNRLIEMARGDGAGRERGIRLAAIQALGHLGDERAIPVLERNIDRRMTFNNEKDLDVRAMSAYALKTIDTAAAMECIERHKNQLRYTRMDLLDQRVNRSLGTFGTTLLHLLTPWRKRSRHEDALTPAAPTRLHAATNKAEEHDLSASDLSVLTSEIAAIHKDDAAVKSSGMHRAVPKDDAAVKSSGMHRAVPKADVPVEDSAFIELINILESTDEKE